MAIKINLGSGYRRFDGFINIDGDLLVNPEYVIELDDVNIKLPFEDSSVSAFNAPDCLLIH